MADKTVQFRDTTGASFNALYRDSGGGSYEQIVYRRGQKVRATCAFTRPADSTPYTAKDAVGVSIAISSATNATPIVVTSALHGLADGDPVTIASVGGNTAANANSYAKVTGYSTTSFALYSDAALTTPVAGNGAYTSGGTIARLLRFKNVARVVGGSGSIVGATILTSQTTNTETYRVHLYSTPPTALLDNAACTAPLYADMANYVGTFMFPAAATGGSGGSAAFSNAAASQAAAVMPMNFVCSALVTDLYGILETPTGYTPATSQTFTLALITDQD